MVVTKGQRRFQVIIVKVLDRFKWLMVSGVYYVNPDFLPEFTTRHGPLQE